MRALYTISIRDAQPQREDTHGRSSVFSAHREDPFAHTRSCIDFSAFEPPRAYPVRHRREEAPRCDTRSPRLRFSFPGSSDATSRPQASSRFLSSCSYFLAVFSSVASTRRRRGQNKKLLARSSFFPSRRTVHPPTALIYSSTSCFSPSSTFTSQFSSLAGRFCYSPSSLSPPSGFFLFFLPDRTVARVHVCAHRADHIPFPLTAADKTFLNWVSDLRVE